MREISRILFNMPTTLLSPLQRIFITQRFGVNSSYYKKYGMKGHNGIDFRTRFLDGKTPTPQGHMFVYSMAPGVVTEIKDEGTLGYGRYIRIKHDDGSESIYGHLSKWYVKFGARVTEKTLIALTDNTGDSTGSHLHVGYRPPNWQSLYGNGYKGYVNFQSFIKTRL